MNRDNRKLQLPQIGQLLIQDQSPETVVELGLIEIRGNFREALKAEGEDNIGTMI